jgi:cell division initiation protein
MFTPQQIDQISFSRATFGGYDMHSVDEFLEPLTEDYITLYKENALLKSKMRVLVAKLEEYRKSEASMKDAIATTQTTCDKMVKDAEAKCRQMLDQANVAAAENAKNADALIAEENARLDEARRTATEKIEQIEAQLNACIQALEHIKGVNRVADQTAKDSAEAAIARTNAVADEISSALEATIGTTEDQFPVSKPEKATGNPATGRNRTGTVSTSTGRNDLKFGNGYDPLQRR